MQIKWVGTAGIRIVEALRWDEANGWLQEVDDAQMCVVLLTDGGFEVAKDEPLRQIAGEQAQNLPLAGVATIGQLAAANADALAAELKIGTEDAARWVAEAKRAI